MKKKIIHGLLAALTLASTTMFAANVNQTFIAHRGTISDNALISRACHRMHNKSKDAIGAVVSAAAFYRQSHNHVKLAQYFGDGTAAVPTGLINVALTTATTTGLNSGQVDPQIIDNTTSAMYGNVALSPRRIEAGAQLQWSQSLDKLVEGLSFDVSAPVTYVRTSLRPTYTGTANSLAASLGGGKGLADYFGGASLGKSVVVGSTYAVTLTQAALANAIISPTHVNTTQVADVKVALGYTFLKKAHSYRLGALLTGNIPTGKKPAGVYAFEPVAGSRHFSLGGGLDAWANLWKTEDGKTSFNVRANAVYSYGFAAEEIRTLGLTNYTTGRIADGQYIVVGDEGTVNMMPLANVSTLAVKVTPRSRVEATAGLTFNYERFAASVSYNLFYNQAEKLELTGAFDQTTYGTIAKTGFDGSPASSDLAGGTTHLTFELPDGGTTKAFSPNSEILAPGLASSTNVQALDLGAATTPEQVVHKVGADLSYGFGGSIPVRAAVGGEVELSSNNASINSWGVWAKVGFGF